MPKVIDDFRGEYRFLSNFYPGDNTSVEHRYQAAKTNSIRLKVKILTCKKPWHARQSGKEVILKEGWEEEKEGVMFQEVLMKFLLNKDLADRLIATDGYTLIEGNWWHDNKWGDCKCDKCKTILGQNLLGKILMLVRIILIRMREGKDGV